MEKMLLSVGHPIDQVLIVDNSCSGYVLPKDVEAQLSTNKPIGYIRPFTALGYGGAINQGIMQTAYAPWWFWSSNDIVYEGGTGDYIAETMDNASGPTFISYGFVNGAINPDAIDAVGLVDEWNFFPIYEDDIDYYRRLRLGGVNVIDYKGLEHGQGGKASTTIMSDPAALTANAKSHQINQKRYIAKWGGYRNEEKFDTPFNTGLPLWYTRPDIRARAQRMW